MRTLGFLETQLWLRICLEVTGQTFHLGEGKAFLILQKALRFVNLKDYKKMLRGHRGKNQRKR